MSMTEKECFEKIVKFCNKELKKTGWFIFNDHNVTLEKTRLLNDYEKEANLPLPLTLKFETACIDSSGIQLNGNFYKWADICTTVIKNDTVPTNFGEEGRFRTDKYLVLCLYTGEVLQLKLDRADNFRNLLGHFIEQYKSGIRR